MFHTCQLISNLPAPSTPRRYGARCSATNSGPLGPGELPDPRKDLEVNVDRERRIHDRSKSAYDYEKKKRKGRPSHRRSPDDTPMRDGNRDRLYGLLTERAGKTLAHYLMETNPTLMQWWVHYMKANPIPRDGDWDDVSGETFLRQLLTAPNDITNWGEMVGVPAEYNCTGTIQVDPPSLAQRVLDIRQVLAAEFVDDLIDVKEENSMLLREKLASDLMRSVDFERPEDVPGEENVNEREDKDGYASPSPSLPSPSSRPTDSASRPSSSSAAARAPPPSAPPYNANLPDTRGDYRSQGKAGEYRWQGQDEGGKDGERPSDDAFFSW